MLSPVSNQGFTFFYEIKVGEVAVLLWGVRGFSWHFYTFYFNCSLCCCTVVNLPYVWISYVFILTWLLIWLNNKQTRLLSNVSSFFCLKLLPWLKLTEELSFYLSQRSKLSDIASTSVLSVPG